MHVVPVHVVRACMCARACTWFANESLVNDEHVSSTLVARLGSRAAEEPRRPTSRLEM